MAAVVRFFAAVDNGTVVASCSTLRPYRYAVLQFIAAGAPPHATWRTTYGGARRALLLNGTAQKRVVPVIETTSKLPIGTSLDVVELERLYQLAAPTPNSQLPTPKEEHHD
jgi:hypothetical protein